MPIAVIPSTAAVIGSRISMVATMPFSRPRLMSKSEEIQSRNLLLPPRARSDDPDARLIRTGQTGWQSA
jgi:hypothetical protein